VHLYEDGPLTQIVKTADHYVDRGTVHITAGTRVRLLGGAEYEIVAATTEHVLLNGEAGSQKFKRHDFEALISTGDVSALVDSRPDVVALLLRYSDERKVEAKARLDVIKPMLDADTSPPSRTHQRWIASYREAEVRYGTGHGILGLLADTADRGNYEARLEDQTEQMAADAIRKYFLNPDQLTKRQCHRFYEIDSIKAGVPAMSKSTFFRRINDLRLSDIAQGRWGKRAAYAEALRSPGLRTGSDHGLYAQERVLAHRCSTKRRARAVTWSRCAGTYRTPGDSRR